MALFPVVQRPQAFAKIGRALLDICVRVRPVCGTIVVDGCVVVSLDGPRKMSFNGRWASGNLRSLRLKRNEKMSVTGRATAGYGALKGILAVVQVIDRRAGLQRLIKMSWVPAVMESPSSAIAGAYSRSAGRIWTSS